MRLFRPPSADVGVSLILCGCVKVSSAALGVRRRQADGHDAVSVSSASSSVVSTSAASWSLWGLPARHRYPARRYHLSLPGLAFFCIAIFGLLGRITVPSATATPPRRRRFPRSPSSVRSSSLLSTASLWSVTSRSLHRRLFGCAFESSFCFWRRRPRRRFFPASSPSAVPVLRPAGLGASPSARWVT